MINNNFIILYIIFALFCFVVYFLLVQSQCNLVNRHIFGSKTSKFGLVTLKFYRFFKWVKVVKSFEKQSSYNPTSFVVSCWSTLRTLCTEKIQLWQRTCLKPTIFRKRRLLFWTGLSHNLISFSIWASQFLQRHFFAEIVNDV